MYFFSVSTLAPCTEHSDEGLTLEKSASKLPTVANFLNQLKLFQSYRRQYGITDS